MCDLEEVEIDSVEIDKWHEHSFFKKNSRVIRIRPCYW